MEYITSSQGVAPVAISQTKRIEALDIAKGLAIFLVVWMHCIQYIGNSSFDNQLYSIVYSFHMPLFLLISGYLFYKSLGKDFRTTIKKRAVRLLVPNLLWGGYLAIIFRSFSPSFILTSFWFLYTLFVCCILYLIVNKFTNIWLSVIILSLVILLLPGLEYIKFSLPFFGIGLIMGKYRILTKISKNKTFVIALIVSAVLSYLILWDKSWYVYLTPNPSILHFESSKWIAYFGRLFQGTFTSLAILALLVVFTENMTMHNSMPKFRQICRTLSDNSLGLYVIHLFVLLIVSMLLEKLAITFMSNQILISTLTLIIAMMMICAFVPLQESMKKNRYLKYHC